MCAKPAKCHTSTDFYLIFIGTSPYIASNIFDILAGKAQTLWQINMELERGWNTQSMVKV